MSEKVIDVLPEFADVGKEGRWALPNGTTEDSEIDARFLGIGESRREQHEHAGDFATKGAFCGRCRWTEIRIFKTATRYVISYTKATEVPGESDRYQLTTVGTAKQLVSTLIQPPRRSRPAENALQMASRLDDDVSDAFLGLAR